MRCLPLLLCADTLPSLPELMENLRYHLLRPGLPRAANALSLAPSLFSMCTCAVWRSAIAAPTSNGGASAWSMPSHTLLRSAPHAWKQECQAFVLS